jgi:mRNA-degrading endonuclease toxin of MazEF toxin-antitoxin module
MAATWAPPEPGDIVWCRFPDLPRRSPGAKSRPALVCQVTEREDGVAVAVAYGTSQGLARLHAGEFAITKSGHPAAYRSAGLSFDTKFALLQVVELPWNEDFFAVPVQAPFGQTPKLGSLHASMMRAAQAAHDARRV